LKPTSSVTLFETIRCENGTVYNLKYHQKRCNKSRKELYRATDTLDLETLITPPESGLYRCRIVYNTQIKSIEYIPYVPKKINTFKIIPSSLDYHLKYTYRDTFNKLLSANSNTDEIIIEKEGYITDTTIANIAFYDKKQWVTPAKPLLEGTMRQKLIEEGFLQTKQIKANEIGNYSQVALMNAMVGFKILKNIRITNNKGHYYDY